MESKENTRFITTIQKITLPTELGARSSALCSSKLIMCQISLVAVYMMNTPPSSTIRLCTLIDPSRKPFWWISRKGSWKYWITLSSPKSRAMRRPMARPIPMRRTRAC